MTHVVRDAAPRLVGSLVRPPHRPGVAGPGVLLCHGFPPGGAAHATVSLPELAERVAAELGWTVLVPGLRGCAGSQGDFSLDGWLVDLADAAEHLRAQPGVEGVWIAGFGTGGALAICAAAQREWIRGVAALGSPADFHDWSAHPRRLVEHARSLGLITDPSHPASMDAFTRGLKEVQAVECASHLAPRDLLVVHGSEDDLVPVFDARVIVDAHGDAELRIIAGAGHQLRYDPRAMAVLLGWLDRQRRAQYT